MRWSFALVGFALASSGYSQTLKSLVTFTCKAARASEVLKSLGAQAHLSLLSTPEMGNEVIVVSATNVQVEDLLNRIATATSGSWKQEGQSYRLIANSMLRRQEDKKEITDRAVAIRKLIETRVAEERKQQEALAKRLAIEAANQKATKNIDKTKTDPKLPPIPQTTQTAGDMPSGAEESAITHLLLGIDASVLAQLGPKDRIVFSTNPTRRQRQLGSDATGIINNFILTHNSEVSRIPAESLDTDSGDGSEAQIAAEREMMKLRNSTIGEVAKALLAVKRSGGSNFVFEEAELRLYDAKGKVVFSGSSSLSLDPRTLSDVPVEYQAKVAPVVPSKETPIEFSDESNALIKAFSGMETGILNFNLPPKVHKALFRPDLNDPLSFIQTDALLALAKSLSKPIVADIPDDWDGGTGGAGPLGMGKAGLKLESVVKNIKEGSILCSVPDSQFLVLKPTHPTKSRQIRTDRVALASLMRAVEEKGIPSLDDLSQFAVNSPDPMENGIGFTYLICFVPGGGTESINGLTNWDMLRFFGYTSPDSRLALANGTRISFSNLNAGQRDALENMTYGSQSLLSIDDGKITPDDGLPEWYRNVTSGMMATDFRQEPTEVCPDGLPSDGFFDIRLSSETFASPQSKDDKPMFAMLSILGPDEMSLFRLMRESKDSSAQMNNFLPLFTNFKLGQRTNMAFTFHLASQTCVKQTLRDHRMPAGSPAIAENNFPSDFQKAIAKKLDFLKKSPMGGAMSGGPVIHP